MAPSHRHSKKGDMKNTIQDLIEILQKQEDKKLIVHLEGCDCYGDWNGKATMSNYESDYFLLGRDI